VLSGKSLNPCTGGLVPPLPICYIGAVDALSRRYCAFLLALVAELVDALP